MALVPPDTISVQTADNVSLSYATAGVGSRMVAQLVDNAIALILVMIALAAALAVASHATSQQGAVWATLAAVGASLFVYFGYFLLAECVSGGRTPGKAAMGLRVMQVNGGAADVTALIVRNVVRPLDDVAGIGVIVMFFHPLSRRLGDLAAGTIVVRDRSPMTLAAATAPPAPLLLRTPDAGPPIDGVQRLGAAEANALHLFLSRQGLQPAQRARLAADIAGRLYERLQLPPQAPERMWPPELFLERLYLQLAVPPR